MCRFQVCGRLSLCRTFVEIDVAKRNANDGISVAQR